MVLLKIFNWAVTASSIQQWRESSTSYQVLTHYSTSQCQLKSHKVTSPLHLSPLSPTKAAPGLLAHSLQYNLGLKFMPEATSSLPTLVFQAGFGLQVGSAFSFIKPSMLSFQLWRKSFCRHLAQVNQNLQSPDATSEKCDRSFQGLFTQPLMHFNNSCTTTDYTQHPQVTLCRSSHKILSPQIYHILFLNALCALRIQQYFGQPPTEIQQLKVCCSAKYSVWITGWHKAKAAASQLQQQHQQLPVAQSLLPGGPGQQELTEEFRLALSIKQQLIS